jgi:hypothetical protein
MPARLSVWVRGDLEAEGGCKFVTIPARAAGSRRSLIGQYPYPSVAGIGRLCEPSEELAVFATLLARRLVTSVVQTA